MIANMNHGGGVKTSHHFHTEPDYDKLTNIIRRGVVYEGIG